MPKMPVVEQCGTMAFGEPLISSKFRDMAPQ